MNITELDQYNLADAVKFHNRLNPRLWGPDEQLLPEVRSKLLEIAADFQEFLGLSDLDVQDITLSGSNAAYSYTPHSDIDLHLVVNVPKDEVYQELFNAKKYQYNDIHNIRVRKADVELYVQPADESPVSLGEYSIKNDQWIEVPKRKRARIDQTLVRHKYEDLKARIESALRENDSDRVQALVVKIKEMRRAGLDAHGEFGPENLAFKMLRSQGWIKRLYDHSAAVKDQELSLKEEPKKKFRYGYGTDASDYRTLFKPTAPKAPAANQDIQFNRPQDYEWFKQQQAKKRELAAEDAGETWDGVNPTTCMFLNEDDDQEKIVHEFIQWAAKKLGIDQMPEIFVHTDPEWSVKEHSFGRYEPDSHSLHVNMANRHLFDILRTTAHELAHCKQNLVSPLPDDAGETGSEYENEAHAAAGIIMRDFADAHPELFDTPALQESASGYIPTAKEKNDPRYSMALTVDIKPGQVGKEANKMGLKTDSQGKPGLLMKTVNLRESRDDGNEPRGPEFRPTMPRGTVRVNVSDVYDWYKLGKNIANLDRANPADFGKGPPSTIVSFGDEDTEHKYIKNLKKLGLTTTDIDPKDPNQPAGLPRQSTDPTYNVDEGKMAELEMDLEDSEISDSEFEKMYGMTRKEAREQFSQTDMWAFPEIRDPNRPLHEQGVAEDDLVESLRQEFALLEDEFLGEIKMSPTNLRAEAAKTGAQAGMEFEMIVPGAGTVDSGDYDMEPDYDQDERVRGFGSIRDFFYDGDYNGRRDVDRLEEQLINDYYDSDWLSEKKLEEWQEVAEDHIRDLVDRDYEGEFREQAREEVMDNTPEFGVNSDELSAAVEQRYEELRDAKINEIMADMGPEYDEAYEEWEQNEWQDMANNDGWQDEWLEYQGITTMSDVSSNYDISWPYYYDTNEGEEADIDAIADDFSNAVGKPVNASRSYHGARREAGHYVVEPDGSLEGDNPGDTGLEFVSPPMPIDEMMSDLNKVKKWADREGCYTNDSTGLHINISVPNYSLRELDYVKLALLLGDKYVLEQFGRVGNTYCKAAIGKVQDKVRQYPDTSKELLDKMRNGMEQLASKAIHSGTTDKYTSINTKDGYIEFRSPGGDWLNANFDKIENTLLRFTVALSAAMDPEAYRQEYLKKLYKLLEPTAVETKNPDTIKYFADYVAGKTPRAALRSFVKQAQLERKLKKDPTGGQPYWWRVSNPGQSYGEIEVVATTKEEAIEKALLPDGYPSWARTRASIQAVPVRPYDASPLKATMGQPQAIGQASGPTVGGRPSNPAGRWVITPEADRRSVVYRFNAAGFDDANVVRRQWAQEHPGVWIVQRDDNQTLGQPAGSSRNALSQTDIENRLGWPDQTGDANYEVVDRSNMQPVFKFVANTDQDAQRKYSQFLDVMMLPHDTENYGYREIALPGSTVALQRARAEQQQQPAPQPMGAGRELVGWDILMGGQPVHRISGIGNNQGDANRIAQQWILQQGSDFLRQYQDTEFEVVPAWREA